MSGPADDGRQSLARMLDIDISIDVVDIGASPIRASGRAPYRDLLEQGRARLTGFEPDRDALARLEAAKGPGETYLPHAVYDGSVQELRLCRAPGMTSLLEPNRALLDCFHGFDTWAEVTAREPVQTVRLDDVTGIAGMDFLKIDIQGAELEVLRNATGKLAGCLALQTEVEFLEMYENQPLFTDIDLFLRARGFVLHRFERPTSRTVRPLVVNDDPYAGLGQLVWADAVFIRDFTRFDRLSPAELLKLALILHDIYRSFDLALRALLVRDAMTAGRLGQRYLGKLRNR